MASEAALPGSGSAPIIRVESVSKSFGRTRALIDLSLSVDPGEFRALVGRNGAGKSTLVSLLTGLQKPDSGEVLIDGMPAAEADSLVACVYQHSRLVPALTVGENIAMGQFPASPAGLISWGRVHATAIESLEPWGLSALADTPVERLEPVQAKVVEICRALARRPRVLLLDEPTAGLDRRDAEQLFEFIDRLRSQGVTLLYVSHHLDEIYRLCDSITVLRDARHIVTSAVTSLPKRALVAAMVGDGPDAETAVEQRSLARVGSAVRLEVNDVALGQRIESFSLTVHEGECVGVAGLDGSGKVEIGAVLAGLIKPDAGSVTVDGRSVRLGDVRAALDAGVGYVPPDRHKEGMVSLLPISENATLTAARKLSRPLIPGVLRVLLNRDRDRYFRRLAAQWEIVSASPEQPISELSGGNQQKCVMARGIATNPAVLVLQNPTAGIDVAAKASITATLDQILTEGACAVVISEDAEDFVLCSRIVIVFQGRVISTLHPGWTDGELVAAMQGEAA